VGQTVESEETAGRRAPRGGDVVAGMVRWALIAAVINCAGWLRVDGLEQRHLWLDEALSWRLATLPFTEIVSRTSEATTVHPPLFFILLRAWMLIGGDSEWWLRCLACVFGVACVPAAYMAARNLVTYLGTTATGDRSLAASSAGYVAGIVVALNPFQVHLAQQVRGYTLTVLLCLLSTAALAGLLGTAHRRTGWFIFYVMTAALACYTHHLAGLTAFAQAIFALCWTYWPPRSDEADQAALDRRRSLRRTVWWAGTVLFILVLPLAYPLLRQSEAAADAWMRPIRGRDISRELTEALALTSSSPERVSELVDLVSLVVLGAMFTGFLFACGWPGRCVALLGSFPVWVLAVYSLLASRSLFDARYFAFAQVMWLVGCGVLVARFSASVDRWAVGASICLLCAQLPLLQSPVEQRLEHGIRAAVAQLRRQVTPGDLVIATTPPAFFEASYYGRHDPEIGLLSETKTRLAHEAAAHLHDHELVDIGDAMDRSPPRIWILTMPAYDRAAERSLPLLGRYSLVRKSAWKQDWTWERSVELLEYSRVKTENPDRQRSK
jgi:mannosyltransferase